MSDAELRERAREMARDCRIIAEQAERVFRRFLSLVGKPAGEADGFAARQLGHWAEFLASAARPVPGELALPDHHGLARALYVSWQFPSYPSFLGLVGRRGWLVLVAENRFWIESVVGSESTCNFRDPRLSSRLPRAFAEGRTVYAMMDYCYPESAHVVAPFLGLPARTPSGILKLARRFDYTIHVASAGVDGPVVLDSIPPAELDVDVTAARINRAIGEAILESPSRWLNWAMADHRFAVDFWPERIRSAGRSMRSSQ